MQLGRSCPLHYRYAPSDFARAPDLHADTLYVIGGLYGNVPALEAVLAMAAREKAPATLVFNGDFNWFNIDDSGFCAINDVVLRHHALRGNVETEIANDSTENADAGCGCAYPDWVNDAEVERSNSIIVKLRDAARRHPTLRAQLAALPMHQVAEVGGMRIAIVHGDLESLAGWNLSQEIMAEGRELNIIHNQILTSTCRIVASSHTCLPVALAFDTARGRCAVFNNGAAGMPNFRGALHGVITRIATTPCTASAPLYGTRIDGIHIDALPVQYDNARFHEEFMRGWPEQSAAHASYYRRIVSGPDYAMSEAIRL